MTIKFMRYGLLIVIALLLLYLMRGLFFQTPPVKVGDVAPDFHEPSLSGKVVSRSQYLGEPLVINFFTTWCAPCQQEAPDLVQFHSDIANQKVAFLMIDRRETANVVKQFANKYHLSNDIVLDQHDELAAPYGLTGQPETFFIDRNGIVRDHVLGPLTSQELEQYLEETKQPIAGPDHIPTH